MGLLTNGPSDNKVGTHEEHWRQSHCPLEIFFSNFHCYSTAYCTWYEATIVNSTTFHRIVAWRDTVFLRVSPAQRVSPSSKSHRTSTDPQCSSFPPHFHGPLPGIPGGRVGWGGGRGIHWLNVLTVVVIHVIDDVLVMRMVVIAFATSVIPYYYMSIRSLALLDCVSRAIVGLHASVRRRLHFLRNC